MKLGYPCINRRIGCTANSTFRLSSYSDAMLIRKVDNNLTCLHRILEYNVSHNLLFFRISSDLIPFAGHPICRFNWKAHFKTQFMALGTYIKTHNIRISMHPDQFVVINSTREDIVKKSVDELKWHCEVLDLMELDDTAKVQIHVGGVYGDRKSAVERFVKNYNRLPDLIKRRLVIENDERLYSLRDCILISKQIDIPVIFDSFHHSCLNNNETPLAALTEAATTWRTQDGVLMTDYSSQQPNSRPGRHAEHLDIEHFRDYINDTIGNDFDIMLEIKDKEASALKAIQLIGEQKP